MKVYPTAHGYRCFGRGDFSIAEPELWKDYSSGYVDFRHKAVEGVFSEKLLPHNGTSVTIKNDGKEIQTTTFEDGSNIKIINFKSDDPSYPKTRNIKIFTRKTDEGKYLTKFEIPSQANIRHFGKDAITKYEELMVDANLSTEQKKDQFNKFIFDKVKQSPSERYDVEKAYNMEDQTSAENARKALPNAFEGRYEKDLALLYNARGRRPGSLSAGILIEHDEPLEWKDDIPPPELVNEIQELVSPIVRRTWYEPPEIAQQRLVEYTQPVDLDLSKWVDIKQEKTVEQEQIKAGSADTVEFLEHIHTSSRLRQGFRTFQHSSEIDKELSRELALNGNYKAIHEIDLKCKMPGDRKKLLPVDFSYKMIDGKQVFCRSEYLGLDRHSYPPRTGNYYAHSLIPQSNEPISFWQMVDEAPWTRELTDEQDNYANPVPLEIPTNEPKPRLSSAPKTAQYLQETKEFLAQGDNAARMKEIIANAIEGKKMVVVDNPQELTMWMKIFSISFPPHLMKELSFSSCRQDLRRSTFDLTGTAPENVTALDALKQNSEKMRISGKGVKSEYADQILDIFQNHGEQEYNAFMDRLKNVDKVKNLKHVKAIPPKKVQTHEPEIIKKEPAVSINTTSLPIVDASEKTQFRVTEEKGFEFFFETAGEWVDNGFPDTQEATQNPSITNEKVLEIGNLAKFLIGVDTGTVYMAYPDVIKKASKLEPEDLARLKGEEPEKVADIKATNIKENISPSATKSDPAPPTAKPTSTPPPPTTNTPEEADKPNYTKMIAAAGGGLTLMGVAAYNNSQENKAEASQTSHQDRLQQQAPEKKKGLSFATVASATIGALLTGWAIYMFATGRSNGQQQGK